MKKPPEKRLAYAPQMHGKAPPKVPTVRQTTPDGRMYGPEFQQKGRK